MQILQWLFKSSNNKPSQPRLSAAPALPTPQPTPAIYRNSSRKKSSTKEAEEIEEKSRDVSPYNWTGKRKAENRAFTILLSDNGNEYIYSTLHLKQLRLCEGQRRSFWKTKMCCKGAEIVNVNCKVLPICDAAASLQFGVGGDSREGGDDGSGKELKKSEGRRISKIKELLKWEATSKSSRGTKGWKVMYFGNKLDSLSDSNSSSSEISFMWELGNYSVSTNVNSPLFMAPSYSYSSSSRNDHIWTKKIPSQPESSKSSDHAASIAKNIPEAVLRSKNGQWITTDSDFVVLEL